MLIVSMAIWQSSASMMECRLRASHEEMVAPAGSECVAKSNAGGAGGEATMTAGTVSTVIPRAVEAAAVVARLLDSAACTAAAVVAAQ